MTPANMQERRHNALWRNAQNNGATRAKASFAAHSRNVQAAPRKRGAWGAAK